MKQGMKRRPIVVGVALLTIVLILGFVLYVASYPQSFPTYGYGISSSVYRMTGGLIGRPPVELQVGQQLIEGNGSMTITWNGEIPEGAYPEVYFGKDSDFVNVYALNVANNRNVDIVKIAICYYSPTNYPPMRPWYTNSSFMESGWGPVTSWAFTNVTIAPHSSSVIYNATFISTADRIIFYFADNSTYAENPSYVPFPYSKYPVYNISQILN